MTGADRENPPRRRGGLALAFAVGVGAALVLLSGEVRSAWPSLLGESEAWVALVRERLPEITAAGDHRLRWLGVAVGSLTFLCLVQFQISDWRSRRLLRHLRERQAALGALEEELRARERDQDALEREYSTLRDRHREFVDDAHDLSYRHDLDGRLLDVNEAGARTLGWTRAELIGRSIDELLAPDARQQAREALGKIVAHRSVRHESIVLLDRGGRPHWYEVTLRLEGGDGVAKAVEAVGRDVSERMREDAQRSTLSRLASAVAEARSEPEARTAALGILCRDLHWEYGELWWEDPEFGVLRCAGTFCDDRPERVELAERVATKTFGKGTGLAGRAWGLGAPRVIQDVSKEPDCSALAERHGFRSALAIPVGDASGVDGVAVLLSSRERDLEDTSLPFVERLGATLLQLCRRKAAEQALRASETRKQAILESALDCIVTVDDRRRILEFNPAAEHTFGYPRGEVLGRVVDDLIVPDDEREAHVAGFQRYLETGKLARPGRVERTARHADGHTFPIEVAVTPIHAGDRPIFTAHLRDITERKQIERLKDELVSTVSHELRTPLASMRGFVELLLFRDYTPDKRRHFLGIIDGEIRRLGRLIDDFLDLQRLEAGALDYEYERADLRPIAKEVFDTFRTSHEGHSFEWTEETEPLPVRIDADRIRQVLLNLLSNAVKYSPDGGCVRVVAAADAGLARVSVEDEGIGMAQETVSKLFTKFYRADGADTRSIGGTGLGLALVKEIVETHEGQVHVESEPGRGSRFTVSLPLCAADPAAERAPDASGDGPRDA
ncbi:MAG: PAS domain S-box protein [Myxococcota bacterium]